jgi:hypothetical protein
MVSSHAVLYGTFFIPNRSRDFIWASRLDTVLKSPAKWKFRQKFPNSPPKLPSLHSNFKSYLTVYPTIPLLIDHIAKLIKH